MTYTSNIVKDIVPEYENAKIAGIQAEDEIVSVNGKRIRLLSDLEEALKKSEGKELKLQIKRAGKRIDLKETPVEIKTKTTGIYLNAGDTQVIALEENSPAALSGIQLQDVITHIDETEVENNTEKLLQILNLNEENDNIEMTIKRDNQTLVIQVEPRLISTYYLGVELETAQSTLGNKLYYGFWDTNRFSLTIVDNLRMLFTGHVSSNQLMGPVRYFKNGNENERARRLYLSDCTYFTIFRCNKFTSISTIRWW